LVFLRARYYNPANGRFQSRDTWEGDVKSPMSLNRWNYVDSNPINYIDPSGNIEVGKDGKEAKKAYDIVKELRDQYNVHIVVDWGFMENGMLRSILPVSFDHAKLYGWDCSNLKWERGLWNIDDLTAVSAGVHIMSAGIRFLGGDFRSLVHQTTILRENGTSPVTISGQIHYRVDNAKRYYKLYGVIHETGHVISGNNNPQFIDYFMSQLGSYCDNQVPYCSIDDKQNPTTYNPGYYAGTTRNPIAFMPSKYATHGNSEDFAETFREVVNSAYFQSGDNAYLPDARLVYNAKKMGFNHNIGMRRVVMHNIIDGTWNK
jgi:hypothetical protein